MGQQPATLCGPRPVPPCTENQIESRGVGRRVQHPRRCGCVTVRVHAHLAEIVTKPRLEICARGFIERLTEPGAVVYDPFLGSGTSLIAAERSARRCYGLEISPAYAQVCIERWQDFSGAKAVLLG